jgi:hypothetical protein
VTHPHLRFTLNESLESFASPILPSMRSVSSTPSVPAAEKAAPSFFEELKEREKLGTRNAWLKKSASVRLHPKSAILTDTDFADVASKSTMSLLPLVVNKGFHVSSCVPRSDVQWQWQRDDGTFESFVEEVSTELERRFRQGKPFAKLSHEGKHFDVMFSTLTEVSMDGDDVGRSRKVCAVACVMCRVSCAVYAK